MKAFPDPLIVHPLPNGTTWEVMADFPFHGRGGVIVVPKGFRTDFASVPRALWALFPPTGKHSRAAVVHDFLFATAPFPKAQCDAIFYEAMRASGVGRTRAWVMWMAVALFGGPAWRSHRHGRK